VVQALPLKWFRARTLLVELQRLNELPGIFHAGSDQQYVAVKNSERKGLLVGLERSVRFDATRKIFCTTLAASYCPQCSLWAAQIPFFCLTNASLGVD
jgi:hypothetical protein